MTGIRSSQTFIEHSNILQTNESPTIDTGQPAESIEYSMTPGSSASHTVNSLSQNDQYHFEAFPKYAIVTHRTPEVH